MKQTLLVLSAIAILLPSSSFASAKCEKHPKEEWIPEAEMKKKLEGEGYKIKVFKVDGDCYEIYGWDKDGKKVEIYFDTKTLEVVKAEVKG